MNVITCCACTSAEYCCKPALLDGHSRGHVVATLEGLPVALGSLLAEDSGIPMYGADLRAWASAVKGVPLPWPLLLAMPTGVGKPVVVPLLPLMQLVRSLAVGLLRWLACSGALGLVLSQD